MSATAGIVLILIIGVGYSLYKKRQKNAQLRKRIESLITNLAMKSDDEIVHEDQDTRRRAASTAERGGDGAPLMTTTSSSSAEKAPEGKLNNNPPAPVDAPKFNDTGKASGNTTSSPQQWGELPSQKATDTGEVAAKTTSPLQQWKEPPRQVADDRESRVASRAEHRCRPASRDFERRSGSVGNDGEVLLL